ncbi:MAG: acyltransferase [Chitinophagaceae bacterium]
MNKLLFIIKKPQYLLISLVIKLPYFSFLKQTKSYNNQVSFTFWFLQKVMNFGGNKKAYWPVHWSSQVYDAENILIDTGTYPGIMKGCYIQGKGGITFGKNTLVAPNVIIVSANHDLFDNRKSILQPVKVGNYCWIGAGAKIMPGVTLGDFTIVAAGTVVTKSFETGYCVVGGIPAKKIKDLDKNNCIHYDNEIDYIGYIHKNKFDSFRAKNLKV